MNEDLWPLLKKVQQRQWHDIDFQETYGLNSSQFAVLSAIVSSPGLDQQTVSSVTFIGKSTLVAVVTRLEDRRLIHIEASPTDGRRYALYPTYEGRELAYVATPEVLRRNQRFLAPLGENREAFLRSLEVVAFHGQEERRSRYFITSPDDAGPPITVTWGPGRLLRASIRRYSRLWDATIRFPTPQQHAVLRRVRDSPDTSQTALGDAISTTKASVAEMVARLLAHDLIARRRDEADGRRDLLRLTPGGEELLHSIEPCVQEVDDAFFTGLDAAGRRLVVECLARLAEDVAELTAGTRG